jgi:hypothetical protein
VPSYANTVFGASAKVAKRAWGGIAKFFGLKGSEDETKERWGEFDIPKKLMESVKKNFNDRMDTIRKKDKEARKEFIGKLAEGDHAVPLNKIRQMVKIYMRLLASGTPQAAIKAKYEHLRPFAEDLKLVLNRELVETDAGMSAQMAVMAAMFSVGVLKTGIAEGDAEEQFEYEGAQYDIGKPFTSSVNINNFVIDMEADSRLEINFIGDRYRRPKYWVEQKRKELAERAVENLQQSQMQPEKRMFGIEEDEDKRLYKEVWCWDIYLPKQNLMCLFVDGDDRPLEVYQWNGPERGPYDLIGFDWIEGEVLPSAPAVALLPLHNFVNVLMRKLERQAERQKSILVGQRGAEEDLETARTAKDGGTYLFHDPSSFQEVKLHGAEPGNHNILIYGDQQFDIHAGSLPVLAGTQPMSETVGQDQLLHESANTLINEMRREVRAAYRSMIRRRAWYVWTEPLRSFTAERKVPGLDIRLSVQIDPEVREGDFLDYNFDINPHSLQEMTPTEELQSLMGMWERVMVQNLQLFLQAGKMPNAEKYAERVFELSNIEFDDMLISMDMTPGQTEERGEVPMPQQFRRFETVNTRVSRPGHTQAGNNQKMMDMNANLQRSAAEVA